MHGAAQRVDICEQQLEFLKKAMVRPRTRARSSKRKLSAQRKRLKLGIDHKRGQYYEHCKRSTRPRDLKARR